MSVSSTPSNASGPAGPDGFAATLALLEQASQALVGVPVDTVDPSACLETADRLAVVVSRVRLVTNQLVGRVDRTGQARKSGYGSTAAWLRHDAKHSGGDAARIRRAGRELARLPNVRAAAEAGDISEAMVNQICAATALFRKDEDVSVVEDALLRLALDTQDLRLVAIAGGHLRQILHPDGKLSDDEKAYHKRHMTVRPEENGGLSGWFYLPPEPAAKLRALLDKYAKPAGKNGEDDRTQAQRQADVLIQIINQLVNVDVVVVTSADALPDDPDDYDQPPWTDNPGEARDQAPDEDPGDPGDSPDGTGETDPGDPDDADPGEDPDTDAGCDDGVRDADGLTTKERLREMVSKLRPTPTRTPVDVTNVQTREQSWRDLLRHLPALMLPTGISVPQPILPRLMHTSRLYRLIHSLPGIRLSRGTRQIQPRERAAILALYTTCAFDDCQVPAQWCEIDHAYEWAYFRRTRLDELLPACDHHNRDRWNNPYKYKLQRLPDGRWHFKTLKRYRN